MCTVTLVLRIKDSPRIWEVKTFHDHIVITPYGFPYTRLKHAPFEDSIGSSLKDVNHKRKVPLPSEPWLRRPLRTCIRGRKRRTAVTPNDGTMLIAMTVENIADDEMCIKKRGMEWEECKG